MADSVTGTVRPGTRSRTVLMRPDVGAAGHIVQRSDLTSHRVVVSEATLILVEDGRKHIRWSSGESAASTGEALLLWPGERGFHFLPPAALSPGQRVRRLLSAHPSADWSMERLAHETATSIATLRRRLAAEGVTYRNLVQDVRMSHALAMLQNTDVPVLQIAQAAGYASASRFSARFRARFGYLPTDIRGQHRGRPSSLLVKRKSPC